MNEQGDKKTLSDHAGEQAKRPEQPLIEAAAAATEILGEDELEAWAAKYRKKTASR